ncbi:MAG: hypothetical protein ACLFS5_09595, partial [Spirochaetaceae bacterium]
HIRATLGEVVVGDAPGRTDAEQITLFKSCGLAVQDMATARAVVAAGCVAARPIRLRTVEAGIVSGELTEREELENAVAKAVSPEADILGGVEFKRYLNSVVIADCILACIGEVSS